MVDQSAIEEAGRVLAQAAPGAQVILFGSYARGDASADSDLDFLVVEPMVADRHVEMVRLARALRPLRIPVDVVVVSRSYLEDWADVEGTVVHAALREGRVLHASA